MVRPIGERVAVLETKLPALEESLKLSAATIANFSDELEKVQKQLGRVGKFVSPAMWLTSAGLMHLSSEKAAQFFQVAFNMLSAVL